MPAPIPGASGLGWKAPLPRSNFATRPVPARLRGLWRRDWMRFADGTSNTTLRVFYMQGPTLFADLRLPPGQKRFPEGATLDGLSAANLRALMGRRGFTGHTTMTGNRVTWHRHFDYQQGRGAAVELDVGVCRFNGSEMIEAEPGGAYVEQWQRVYDGAGRYLTLRCEAGPGAPERILVVCGDRFMIARDRVSTLPRGKYLADLAGELETAALAPYLDCELAYGRRTGRGGAWRIGLSTIPAREGALAFDPGALCYNRELDTVDEEFVARPGVALRRWQIVDCTLRRADLATFVAGH